MLDRNKQDISPEELASRKELVSRLKAIALNEEKLWAEKTGLIPRALRNKELFVQTIMGSEQSQILREGSREEQDKRYAERKNRFLGELRGSLIEQNPEQFLGEIKTDLDVFDWYYGPKFLAKKAAFEKEQEGKNIADRGRFSAHTTPYIAANQYIIFFSDLYNSDVDACKRDNIDRNDVVIRRQIVYCLSQWANVFETLNNLEESLSAKEEQVDLNALSEEAQFAALDKQDIDFNSKLWNLETSLSTAISTLNVPNPDTREILQEFKTYFRSVYEGLKPVNLLQFSKKEKLLSPAKELLAKSFGVSSHETQTLEAVITAAKLNRNDADTLFQAIENYLDKDKKVTGKDFIIEINKYVESKKPSFFDYLLPWNWSWFKNGKLYRYSKLNKFVKKVEEVYTSKVADKITKNILSTNEEAVTKVDRAEQVKRMYTYTRVLFAEPLNLQIDYVKSKIKNKEDWLACENSERDAYDKIRESREEFVKKIDKEDSDLQKNVKNIHNEECGLEDKRNGLYTFFHHCVRIELQTLKAQNKFNLKIK